MRCKWVNILMDPKTLHNIAETFSIDGLAWHTLFYHQTHTLYLIKPCIPGISMTKYRYIYDKLSQTLSNCSTEDIQMEISICWVKSQNAPESKRYKRYKNIDGSIFYLGHSITKNSLNFNPGWGLRLFIIKRERASRRAQITFSPHNYFVLWIFFSSASRFLIILNRS